MTCQRRQNEIEVPCLTRSGEVIGSFLLRPGRDSTAEGDIFIGIKVPTLRMVSREFRVLPLEDIEILLSFSGSTKNGIWL